MGDALGCVGFSGHRLVEGELRRVRQDPCSPRTEQRGDPSCIDGQRLGRAEGPRTVSW